MDFNDLALYNHVLFFNTDSLTPMKSMGLLLVCDFIGAILAVMTFTFLCDHILPKLGDLY